MFAGGIAGAEQGALVSAMIHVQDSKHLFFTGIPAVDINPVGTAAYQWCPVTAGKGVAVSPEHICCLSQVIQVFSKLIAPAAWSEHIQFSTISVEERNRNLAVKHILTNVCHTEDGKVGSDHLVKVQFRTEPEGIMHPCSHDARHVPDHRHSLGVHHHATANGIGSLLQFR